MHSFGTRGEASGGQRRPERPEKGRKPQNCFKIGPEDKLAGGISSGQREGQAAQGRDNGGLRASEFFPPWAPRPSPGLGLEPLGKFPQLLCLQVCFRALLEKAGLILTSFEGSQTRSSVKGQKESQRKAEKASSALKCRKIAFKALIRLPLGFL